MTTTNYKHRELRYFDWIVGLFVATLIVSNIVAVKLVSLGSLLLDGGTFLFPLAYILGDVLTEVYGYRRARRVIWIGFVSLALTVATLVIVRYIPPASVWEGQAAYESVLGLVPRIVLGSMVGYLIGSFTNAYVMAKLKVKMHGKKLWVRTMSSTVIGSLLDTVAFSVIAFGGLLEAGELWRLVAGVYIVKVLIEFGCTPLTYAMVRILKNKESIDTYDTDTHFSPFSKD